jgi:C-terminal processing protease CtpA/Prc
MLDASDTCGKLQLSYATTRSRRIDTGAGIDNKGIQPDIRLDGNDDWIGRAVEYTEQAERTDQAAGSKHR